MLDIICIIIRRRMHTAIDWSCTMNKKILVFAVASGLVFIASLYFVLSGIDPNWYTARDDGVITLSVARNLVDFGFIGTNPSGPIVEASSAPVQQFLYACLYWIARIGYLNYSTSQSYLSYFLIGALFFSFFRKRIYYSFGVALVSAYALSFFPSFIEWQSSGMENAITNLLFLLAVFLLYEMFSRGRVNYFYAIPLFLASISRIEDIYHIGPLLFIFAMSWLLRYKNYKGFAFFLTTIGVWLAFMTWHYLYFGQLLPNTAYAQDISVINRLQWLFTLDHEHLLQNYELSKTIYWKLGLWILPPAIILFLVSNKNWDNRLISLLCISLLITALFNPFFFGPTRIDSVRTTSFAPLFIMLLLSTWVYFIKSKSMALSMGGVVWMILLIGMSYANPYYLGWSTRGMDDVRREFVSLAKTNDINRPTIANPDLGVMTWSKQLNVVDLGLLGSPVMSHLQQSQAITDYIVKYAAPDFIEAHDYWVDRYCGSFLKEKSFNEKYIQHNSNYDMDKVCSLPVMQMPQIFWVRRAILKGSDSSERKFLDDLQKSLSTQRIAQEISNCMATEHENPQNCSYIARTVYRFIPELRRSQEFQDAYQLFSYPPDRALLIGWKNPQAYQVILKYIYKDIDKTLNYQPATFESDDSSRPFRRGNE